MAKVVLMIMDSFGVGATPDATRFGDVGANTFTSIAKWRASQNQPLLIPNLSKMGLTEVAKLTDINNEYPLGIIKSTIENSLYCAASEKSFGKDTPSGHWELMSCPVEFEWGFFNQIYNDPILGKSIFPPELMLKWMKLAGVTNSYGNCHASGTEIIKQYGAEHIKTKHPICYTSADSVFQVAAHEEHFGLQRLLDICIMAKEIFNEINIARVIARPFIGDIGSFTRTGNRRDYTTEPPGETLLDRLVANNRQMISIGKISDIFAHRGVTEKIKADGIQNLCEATISAYKKCADGGMVFTNLVDFDSHYGHRRDVAGYANAIEQYDAWLPTMWEALADEDYLAISADHGCDPTWTGTDHTREYVPVLIYSKKFITAENKGVRDSFADLGQTLAKILNVGEMKFGKSLI